MSDGTVRGTFDLNVDPGLRGLKALRAEGDRTDGTMRQLGRTMDSLASPTSMRRLDDYRSRVRDVGTTAASTAALVDSSWDSQRRSVERSSDRIEVRVGRLENRVERYGRTRASATVEVNGYDRAMAQVMELERRLDRLSRQRSSPSVGITGGFSNMAGGGIPGGGGGGGGAGGLGLAAKLAIGGTALLPGIQSIGVSSAAVLGSASGALLGAGSIYGGAAGALGVGVGLTAAVAKPAIKELQALQKEQTKYAQVVERYGRASKQAAVAREALTRAESKDPGADVALRQVGLFRSQFRTVTSPARRSVFEGIGNVAVAGRSALPNIGRAANRDTAAVSNAASNFAGFLAGPQSQRSLTDLSTEFARDLPSIERSLQNITSTAEHLTVAARPFFHEAVGWTEAWTHGLASSSAGEARVQMTMRGLVAETKDWGRFAEATFHTVRDIFNMGRPSGDSMVVELTNTLDRWDSWIQRNPQKVSSFFREAQVTTEKVAGALGSIVHLLSQVASSLQPIFNRATGLVSLASGLGPTGTTVASALAYGGFRGGRGGLSAGGVVASGVLGRPVMLSGGSRAAGGTVVGGTASATTRYLMSPGGGATGSPAIGQLPLFLLGARGPVLNTARVATRVPATPESFNARYGDIEGAHYASPVSELGESTGRLRGLLGGAVGGAGKTLGATLAVVAALEAAGKGGSAGQMLQNFGAGSTFGLVHSVNPAGGRGEAFASRFLTGIPQTLSASKQQGVIGRKLTRTLEQPFFDARPGFLGLFNKPTQFGGVAGLNPSSPAFMAQVNKGLAQLESQDGGGGHGKNVIAEVKALRTAYQEAAARARELRKEQVAMREAQSEEHGHRLGSQLGAAFHVETKAGRSATSAFGDVTAGALASMRGMHEAGRKVLAEDTLAWAHQLEKANPELAAPVEALTDRIKGSFHALGRDVQIVNGHILTGSREQWEGISTAMSEPLEKAREKMSKSFTAIQREAVGALTAMGYSPSSAKNLVAGVESGTIKSGQIGQGELSAASTTSRQNQAFSKHHARGGMIGGNGLLDTVPVPGGMAAPGEGWIANRHTLNDLSRATIEKFGLTAQQMISGETRPHSAPMSRYATGGALSGVRAGVRSVAESILGQFPGLSVTSTTGGTHAKNSLHYLGEAVDLGGDAATMLRAADWTGKTWGRSLQEGIHNPNLSIHAGQNVSSGYWGSKVWAEHLNHIHVGVLGGGGARGSSTGNARSSIHLRGRHSGLGGVPGALADRGSSMYAKGLQASINSNLAGAGIGGFSGGGTSKANEALGRRMMIASGWASSEWPALQALWTQESGWNSNSVNASSGAYGIPQALGHGHPFALGDASAQIAWGLNYIRDRYGSPSGAEAHERSFNWYSRGGHTPTWAGWHGGGGEYETRGPVLFGAGEKGRERVSITPINSSSTGHGHRIEVNIANASFATGADIDAVAKEVAARILDELEVIGAGTSDADLIGR